MNATPSGSISALDSVDNEIFNCLNPEKPKSFFLFAGAGSGKTRSLVNVLREVRNLYGNYYRINKNQVAVITYTNAACDEIKNRIEHDSLFAVSTIHSFIWDLIKPYHHDIKVWLKNNIILEIQEIKEQQKKGRTGTKTAVERDRKIESKTKRLANLDNIKQFTYNPNGDNLSKDSLNHSEVIEIGAYFLTNKPLMQDILVKKFPVLLVDESQDTKKELIDAFFEIQKNKKTQFSLGLFGDTMQRIYTDGKENLGGNLPEDWVKPVKKLNHRCPKRVITLINKIRSEVDDQQQDYKEDKEEGLVRFFIVDVSSPSLDKIETENYIAQCMAEFTNDGLWSGHNSDVKILALEHHMAAIRMGFVQLFEPLYKVDRFKTGLLNGTLGGIRFFTHYILPLVKAKRNGDEFAIARIVRQNSPAFEKKFFEISSEQKEILKKVNKDAASLFSLWDKGADPRLMDILINVSKSNLFPIHASLSFLVDVDHTLPEPANEINNEDELNLNELSSAWNDALSCSFSQIEAYEAYIANNARIGTHQGVKGLQFPRVMAILDDTDARGFLFSYEKLFGAKAESETDTKNRAQGKETSIDRTRRLFYVICSRAENSLAIVAYTSNPQFIKAHVLKENWFAENEIQIISTDLAGL